MDPIPEEHPPSALASVVVAEDIGSSISHVSSYPFSQSGGFADVYYGTHSTAGKVALKRPRFTEGSREIEAFLREAETWRLLRHPRVLKFIGIAKIGGFIYLVSPFISKGTLRSYLEANPDADRPRLLGETAEAVGFLHTSGVIHGDIKGNNILIADDIHVLLCDFGLSKPYADATASMARGQGTVRWMGPELYSTTHRTHKSDTYSFGMTIVEVLTGKPPFPELPTDFSVVIAVAAGKRIVKPSSPTAVSIGFSYMWDIAEMCTAAKPEERPDMDTVHSVLNYFNRTTHRLQLIPAMELRMLLEWRAHPADNTPQGASTAYPKTSAISAVRQRRYSDVPERVVITPEPSRQSTPAMSSTDLLEQFTPSVFDNDPAARSERDATLLPEFFDRPRRMALLIAIGYRGLRWPGGSSMELPSAYNDLEVWKRHLIDRFNYPTEHIRALTDNIAYGTAWPTRQQILHALERLVANSKAGDRRFLFISGHSEPLSDNSPPGIVPLDFETAGLVMASEFRTILAAGLGEGATITVVMDTGHSGTFFELPWRMQIKAGEGIRYDINRWCPPDFFKGTIFCLSACLDHEGARAVRVPTGKTYGALTASMDHIFNSMRPSELLKLEDLLQYMEQWIGAVQTVVATYTNRKDDRFFHP